MCAEPRTTGPKVFYGSQPAAQWVKSPLAKAASHRSAFWVLAALLCTQHLPRCLGRSQKMVPLLGLCHAWGDLNFLADGFSLAQARQLWTFGERTGRWKIDWCLSLSFPLTCSAFQISELINLQNCSDTYWVRRHLLFFCWEVLVKK